MSDEVKLACNRTPFKTDSSCDRGNVDTEAFLDFPICRLIDPTLPEAAMPQVDFPVIPFSPPPCACVDIKCVPSKLSVEDRKDIYMNIDFKSIGDCCEGNYEADIDVSIPCVPFEIQGGNTPKPISGTADCSLKEPKGFFNLGLGVEGCSLTVNPSLSISVPKPKEIEFKMEVNTEEVCDGAGGNCDVNVTSADCTQTITATLNLRLPKISKLSVCEEGEVTVTGIGGSGTLNMQTDKDECDNVTFICPKLDLDIPCPIEDVDISFDVKMKWDGPEGAHAQLAEAGDSCTINCTPADIELGLPCPVKGIEIKINASMKWDGPETADTIIAKDGGSCLLVATGEELELGLPCPIDGTDVKLTVNMKWGGPETGDVDLAKIDTGDCKITGLQGDIDLGLECPIKGSDIVLTVNVTSGGTTNTSEVTLATVDTTNCEINCQTGEIDIDVPCQLSANGALTAYTNLPGCEFTVTAGDCDAYFALVCDGGEGSSSPGGGSESEGGGTGSITAVTGVSCSAGGGIEVTTSTFTIDFNAKTVTGTVDEDDEKSLKAKADLARELLAATVKAIKDDPSILSLLDAPNSLTAKRALQKLGMTDEDPLQLPIEPFDRGSESDGSGPYLQNKTELTKTNDSSVLERDDDSLYDIL